MNPTLLVGVLVLVAVVIIWTLMRARSESSNADDALGSLRADGKRDEDSDDEVSEAEGSSGLDALGDEGDEGDDEDPDAEHLALTSDGHAFTPRGHGVLIAPQRHFHAKPRGDDESMLLRGSDEVDPQPPVMLSPGDLIAARVVRGSPDLDPWRVETLGRDRDLVVWPFETREAADTAHALLERRIVRPLRDADGDPVEIGDADFDEAQAELERALDALNAPTEDDEIPPPGTSGSGR